MELSVRRIAQRLYMRTEWLWIWRLFRLGQPRRWDH
jgi:hypothetical protein